MTDLVTNKVVVRAQSGNPEAMGMIYASYHQKIFRYLCYHTGDPQTAEDLTADVFLKMVQALPSFHPNGTPFLAWLFQVAYNQLVDHYRRNKTYALVAIDENLDGAEPAPDSTVEHRLTCDRLSAALSKLDVTQKEVLLLRFIEELTVAETAKIVNKSEDAVKALQRRGLMALRRWIYPNDEEKAYERVG